MSETTSKSVSPLAMNVVLLGVGGWLLYKALSGVGAGAAKVAKDYIAAPIAKAVVWWTMGAPVGVNGKIIVQPSGTVLDPTRYRIEWIKSSDPRAANYDGELPMIVFNGVKYVLGPRDGRGNYPAVKL